MGGVLVGCAVVWVIVTSMTGGNWAAGLVVAGVVLAMCVSGIKAQAAAARRRLVVVEEDELPEGWF